MKKRIFAVDQDRDILDFLELVLTAEGYEVITYASAKNVLDEARKQEPHLILLGDKIGRLSGASICRDLKFDVELQNIPTILLLENSTSYSDIHLIGADDFLLKPLNINVLLQVVEEYLLAKVIHFVPTHRAYYDLY